METTSVQPRWRSTATSTQEADWLPKPPSIDGRIPGEGLDNGPPPMKPEETPKQGEHKTQYTNAKYREPAPNNTGEAGTSNRPNKQH